jgi:hypothetical protein
MGNPSENRGSESLGHSQVSLPALQAIQPNALLKVKKVRENSSIP